MLDSLASSKKAWRIIQSLIGRVVYGGRFNELGGGDLIKLPTISNNDDHPFRVTRSGNTIRFTAGLVHTPYGISSTSPGYSWRIDDAGGYTYKPTSEGGSPIYLMLYIRMGYNIPTEIETTIRKIIVLDAGSTVSQVRPDALDPDAPFKRYLASNSAIMTVATPYAETHEITFYPPDSSGESMVKIPICYLSDTKTVQLLKGNVSLIQLAAHRNLDLWV
jgi:hypothetical protein